jgi:hypothetical protein
MKGHTTPAFCDVDKESSSLLMQPYNALFLGDLHSLTIQMYWLVKVFSQAVVECSCPKVKSVPKQA